MVVQTAPMPQGAKEGYTGFFRCWQDVVVQEMVWPILVISRVTGGPPDPNSNLAGGRTAAGKQDEIEDPLSVIS